MYINGAYLPDSAAHRIVNDKGRRTLGPRRTNRFHLLPRVVLMLRAEGREFTVEDVLKRVFVGRPVHAEQRRRAEKTLMQYADARLLKVSFNLEIRDHLYRGYRDGEEPELTDRQFKLRVDLMKKWPPEELGQSDKLSLELVDYFLANLT